MTPQTQQSVERFSEAQNLSLRRQNIEEIGFIIDELQHYSGDRGQEVTEDAIDDTPLMDIYLGLTEPTKESELETVTRYEFEEGDI